MRIWYILLLLIIMPYANGQSFKAENIFIITTDGFRWQEMFSGADSVLINNPKYVRDTALIKHLFWDDSPQKRREKLLPFFWNTVARNGQLYGNRKEGSEVNIKNPYCISYPGYNELLTGHADIKPVFNTPTSNKNITILEYLNQQKPFQNEVVSFSSWYIFPFILNSQRSKLSVNSGYGLQASDRDTALMVSRVENCIEKKTKTRYDLLTYLTAREYIQGHHPKVVYLSLGETDEEAHQGHYDLYLQQAHNFDRMLGELWYYVQTDPFYKDKTTFIVTTDHGRGSRASTWTTHAGFIKGSRQIWLALLGQGIEPKGEMTNQPPIGLNQVAATAASLLKVNFISNHKVARPIMLPSVTAGLEANSRLR